MKECEYCGHFERFHVWVREHQRPECQVELGDDWSSGYQYKPEFEPTKEKICGCYKVREVIVL